MITAEGEGPRVRPPRTLCAVAMLLVVLGGAAACTSGIGSTGSTTGTDATGAQSTEVSFTSEGTTAYGTLEVPAHPAGRRLAAALLLPGSGPTDRDGNQAGGVHPDTLKLLSAILTEQGIITFRFDKYFTGRTGGGTLAADPQSATIGNDLDQADAAYQLLSHEPDVDTSKLLVVGHSEGGMFALHIATSTRPAPAGLALLEPQDARALDLVRIQFDEDLRDLVRRGEVPASQLSANAQGIARAEAAFRAGQPVDTDGMAPAVIELIGPTLVTPRQPRYLRTWDAVRPAKLASSVAPGTRVLVTDGTLDGKVPTSTIGPLARALTSAGTTGPGLQIIQGTDHDMHTAQQPDDDAVLAPVIVSDVHSWAQPFAGTR